MNLNRKNIQEGGVILTLVLLFSLSMSLGMGYGFLNNANKVNNNIEAMSSDFVNKDFLLRVIDFSPRSTNPAQMVLKVGVCWRGLRPPNNARWQLTLIDDYGKVIGTFRSGMPTKVENSSLFACGKIWYINDLILEKSAFAQISGVCRKMYFKIEIFPQSGNYDGERDFSPDYLPPSNICPYPSIYPSNPITTPHSSPTPSQSQTPSPSPSITRGYGLPTITPTMTATQTPTNTTTPTTTITPSTSPSISITPTTTPSPTITLSPTFSPTPTPTLQLHPILCDNRQKDVIIRTIDIQADEAGGEMERWDWESGIALAGLMTAYEAGGMSERDGKEILDFVETWMNTHLPKINGSLMDGTAKLSWVEKSPGNPMSSAREVILTQPKCEMGSDWFDPDKGTGLDVLHPNRASPAWSLLILNKYRPKPEYEKVISFFADFLKDHTCRETDIGRLHPPSFHIRSEVWDDTLAMIVPFLARYGHEKNLIEMDSGDKYLKRATDELLGHAIFLYNRLEYISENPAQINSFVHGFSPADGDPTDKNGPGCRHCAQWSRGNAWVALSTSELLRYLPSGLERDAVAWIHKDHLLHVVRLQNLVREKNPNNSTWPTVMDRLDFFHETSGTAGIAAALIRSKEVLLSTEVTREELEKLVNTGIDALNLLCVDQVDLNGKIRQVSDGTGFVPWKNADGTTNIIDKYNSISRNNLKSYGQGLFLFSTSADRLNDKAPTFSFDVVNSSFQFQDSSVPQTEEENPSIWQILRNLFKR